MKQSQRKAIKQYQDARQVYDTAANQSAYSDAAKALGIAESALIDAMCGEGSADLARRNRSFSRAIERSKELAGIAT